MPLHIHTHARTDCMTLNIKIQSVYIQRPVTLTYLTKSVMIWCESWQTRSIASSQ